MLLSLFIVSVVILVICEAAEEQKQEKMKKDIQMRNITVRRLLQGIK